MTVVIFPATACSTHLTEQGVTHMKWFNGLMYDEDGYEYITPLFKAADANAAFIHIKSAYPRYGAVDVIYAGEDDE